MQHVLPIVRSKSHRKGFCFVTDVVRTTRTDDMHVRDSNRHHKGSRQKISFVYERKQSKEGGGGGEEWRERRRKGKDWMMRTNRGTIDSSKENPFFQETRWQ